MGRKREGKDWGDSNRMDFHRCYLESEMMYFQGYSINEIAAKNKLMVTRVERWHREYQWEEKQKAILESPRGIGAMLREKLRLQVTQITQGKLEVDKVKEISDLTDLIGKIEGGGGNILAATIEVLNLFSWHLRKNCSDRDEYHLVSSWIQGYLRTLTDV